MKRLAAVCTVFCALAMSGGAAQAQGNAGYEVISRGPGGLELRFRNMPLRGVHADDAQNALAVNFQAQVDGRPFDQLPRDFPDWVSLSYANFDTGVIRSPRPVTFLTRQEADGFSLRIVPRGAAPPQGAPPGPMAMQGPPPPPPQYGPPPPPPPTYAGRYGAYGAIRNYAALNLSSLRRGDDVWRKVYERSALQGNSSASIGSEIHIYHSGDRVIASHGRGRIALGGGLSLIGAVYDADVHADTVRAPNGTMATNYDSNLLTGEAGLAFEMGENTGLTLEALRGNDITGARFTAYTGDPNTFWQLNLAYHDNLRDTPEAILNGGLKDQATIAGGWHVGYGAWASLGGKFTNYGIHGNASIAKTLGWDSNVRWAANFGGWLTGVAYDGHGEYKLDSISFNGVAPTPYIPLSIRNMETHAFTGSLSSAFWGDTLWFDIYGGYIRDRFANDGGTFGGSLRWQPAPGFNIALGARRSNVSLTQGIRGGETRAGLTFNLGFDAAPMVDYF